MAQQGGNPSIDSDEATDNYRHYIESDAAFSATPIVPVASNAGETTSKINSTFIQNQLSLQRSPSAVKDHVSALNRNLSVRSDNSRDGGHDGLDRLLSSGSPSTPKTGRGRLEESISSIVESVGKCNLQHSSSTRSTRSNRSVQSQVPVGAYAVGTLRLHSPSPPRSPTGYTIKHECSKTGDIIVIRDVPAGVLIGYDTNSFTITEVGRFEGIRDLRTGAHFIWAGSSTNSLRNGWWFMSKPSEYGEIHVKRWDRYNEILEE